MPNQFEEMIKFIFFALDRSKEGRIHRMQVLRFVESLHHKKVLTFQKAILPDGLTCDNDFKHKQNPHSSDTDINNMMHLPTRSNEITTIDYMDLRKLCIDYPTMLEPAICLQHTLRRRILGETWWKKKQRILEKCQQKKLQLLNRKGEKQRAAEEERLMKERKEEIRTEIGWISYYFRRSVRVETETKYPMPIVSLDDDTDEVCVSWTQIESNSNDD